MVRKVQHRDATSTNMNKTRWSYVSEIEVKFEFLTTEEHRYACNPLLKGSFQSGGSHTPGAQEPSLGSEKKVRRHF